MESTLRATGPLGSLGQLTTPARKTRRRKAQVGAGEVTVTNKQAGSSSTIEEAGSCAHVRGAGAEALSDVALVEQTLGGKQEAFAMLVERYKDAVQNLAYRMLSNVTEAEDVTQEVFVRAYTQLATYKLAHKFSTWLLSIASHLAIDPWVPALSNRRSRASNRTRFRRIYNACTANIAR